MTSLPKRAYSAAEEWLNSISHGLACVAAIVGCGELLEAVLNATQSFDHAGCASLQLAHFACSLSLF